MNLSQRHSSTAPAKAFLRSRVVLTVGFGGLLLLMALAGLDAVQALRAVQASDDKIREDFLSRNRVLEEIRSDLYLSGTYIRDYLLEPVPEDAEGHRANLLRVRREMDLALRDYQRLLSPEEARALQRLTRELAAYWRVLDPVFRWDPKSRRKRGFIFLRDEVFPRRMAMLGIADQIATMNEAQLNAGKTRVSEAFAASRGRVVLTLAVTGSLGLFLASLSIGRMLRLEREAALRYQETAQARSELKELSARLVSAQESERRAISRELHDEVGQSLSAVLVALHNLAVTIQHGGTGPALNEQVDEIRGLVENGVAVVRNIALLLRPSMLDDLGLVPAVQWQAREVSKRTGIRVTVAAEDVPDELPEAHRTCIYRVVQEALHNISRHAEARRAEIRLKQNRDRIQLSVQDDGRGFDPRQGRGMGLLGMQERVTHLGGTFQVESEPGHGTQIVANLPLPAGLASENQVDRLAVTSRDSDG